MNWRHFWGQFFSCKEKPIDFRLCGEKAKQDGLEDVVELLTRLQCCLQDVMAHFATPPGKSSTKKREITKIDIEMVEWVHAEIDRFGDQLPPLRQFILSVNSAYFSGQCLSSGRR